MKITFLLFLIQLSLSLLTFGQNRDTSILVIKQQTPLKIYSSIHPKDSSDWTYKSCDIIVLFNPVEEISTSIENPILIYYCGKFGVVSLDDLKLKPDQIKTINSWTKENSKKRIEKIFTFDSLLRKADTLNAQIRVGKIVKNTIGVNWDWSEDDFASIKTQNFTFSIFNFSINKIKYIWLTVGIYNPVEDLIQKKDLKMIGPIEQNSSGYYEFKNVFFSNVVEKAKLINLKVQYFNGVIKQFNDSKINDVIITDEDINFITK